MVCVRVCVCVCIAEHFVCPARASNLIIKPTSANSNATASATTTTTEHNNNNTTQFLKYLATPHKIGAGLSRARMRACVCVCAAMRACVVHAQMHTLALIWVALYGNLYGPTQLHVCLHSGNATRSRRVVCHVSCRVLPYCRKFCS